jgi:hypothetical protein
MPNVPTPNVPSGDFMLVRQELTVDDPTVYTFTGNEVVLGVTAIHAGLAELWYLTPYTPTAMTAEDT